MCRNQWYDAKGFGKDVNWEYGPWNMTLAEHSLPDGILHPNSKDHRILLMPNGNLGWIARYLKPDDPRSVIFSEPMFYISKYSISQPPMFTCCIEIYVSNASISISVLFSAFYGK